MRSSDWSSDVCSSDLIPMILHIDKVRFSRLAMTSAVMSMLFLSGCAAFNKPVEQPVKSDYEIAIEKELDAAITRVAAQPRWSATIDRKGVVSGKSVSDRVELGGGRSMHTKKK